MIRKTRTEQVVPSTYHRIAFTNTSFDKFTQARAIVSPLTLSDAILRKGQTLSSGLNGMIQNQTTAITIVTELYVCLYSNLLLERICSTHYFVLFLDTIPCCCGGLDLFRTRPSHSDRNSKQIFAPPLAGPLRRSFSCRSLCSCCSDSSLRLQH